MPNVRLRPMTDAEYDAWVPAAIADYAAEHERAGSRPEGTAQEAAEREFAELLPDGVRTPDHHLLVATDESGSPVGLLWLRIPSASGAGAVAAFVYDVEVDPAWRGKGYGRAIMVAAEEYACAREASYIKLHVFGHNTTARRLYDSLGYEATNISMSKALS